MGRWLTIVQVVHWPAGVGERGRKPSRAVMSPSDRCKAAAQDSMPWSCVGSHLRKVTDAAFDVQERRADRGEVQAASS